MSEFKGNKYVKAGIKPVFKGITESLEFGSTAALSNAIFGEDESVSESMLAGGAFGFGGTVANGFVKALNKDIWDVQENVCPYDHGVGFARRK